jgi:hypothetical protein
MKSKRALFALFLVGAAAVGTHQFSASVEAAAPGRAYSAAAGRSWVENLDRSAPSGALAGEAAYRAVAEAVRAFAPISFESFSEEGGGVVAKGVTVAFGGQFDAGLKFNELRLYGVDPGKIAAPGGLSSPTDAVGIAKRVDIRGMKSFGLAKWMSEINKATTDAMLGAIMNSQPPSSEEAADAMRAASAVEDYAIAAEHLVIDGLMLHGAAASPANSAEGEGLAALFREYAKFGRGLSFDAVAARNITAAMKSGAPGYETTMTYAIEFSGMRGFRRGDFYESVTSGLDWSMASTIPAAAQETAAPPAMAMSGRVDLFSVSDVRFAKLFSYWAKGETPPANEKSLLGLGVWRSFGERYELAGAPFYSVRESVADFSKFQWFAPTSIHMSVADMSLDIGGLMSFAASAAPPDDPGMRQTVATLEALQRHGLSKFDVSSSVSDYLWAPKSGKTSLTGNAVVERIGRVQSRIDAGLPDFKTLAALSPKSGEPFDKAAMASAFAGSTLNGFSAKIVDQGVLERVFALVADMQGAASGGPDGLINPADLRAAMAMTMRASAATSPFGAVATAFADFVAEGGAFTLSAKPKKPVPFVDLAAPSPDAEDPATRLGLSAERTPN